MEQHFQISERKYKTFKNQIPDPVNIISLDKSKTLTGRRIYIYIYISTENNDTRKSSHNDD